MWSPKDFVKFCIFSDADPKPKQQTVNQPLPSQTGEKVSMYLSDTPKALVLSCMAGEGGLAQQKKVQNWFNRYNNTKSWCFIT